jgi:hypothetical protein
VSWATCDAILQSSTMSGDCTGPAKAGIVTRPLSTAGLVSRVYWGVDRGNATQLSNLAEGNATSYMYNYMSYSGINYASPVLHHVLIQGVRLVKCNCDRDVSLHVNPRIPEKNGAHSVAASYCCAAQA